MLGKAQQNICSLCCFLKKPVSKLTGRLRNTVLSLPVSPDQTPKFPVQEFAVRLSLSGKVSQTLKGHLAD